MRNGILLAVFAALAVGGLTYVMQTHAVETDVVETVPQEIDVAGESCSVSCCAAPESTEVVQVTEMEAIFASPKSTAQATITFEEPPLAKPVEMPILPVKFELLTPIEVAPMPRSVTELAPMPRSVK